MYNTDLNSQFKHTTPQVIHAEENAVNKLKVSQNNKPIDIVVFRTNKSGNSLLMAKSCSNCKYIMNKILKKKIGNLENLFLQMKTESYARTNGDPCPPPRTPHAHPPHTTRIPHARPTHHTHGLGSRFARSSEFFAPFTTKTF